MSSWEAELQALNGGLVYARHHYIDIADLIHQTSSSFYQARITILTKHITEV